MAAVLATEREGAVRRLVLRQALRLWGAKAEQDRADLADELVQLFTASSSTNSSSSSSGGGGRTSTTPATTAEALALRPITRRPGIEEVRNCILTSPFPAIPLPCAALRGEIWQVLLHVYKRNQHGTAALEFERMILRLGKLPRDPRLVDECAAVSHLLVDTDESLASSDGEAREGSRAKVQADLEILLVWFLTTKSVEFVPGMARVVGVFFAIGLPLPTVYDCFYQFCANFLPHFVQATTNAPFGGRLATNGMGKLDPEHGSTSTATVTPDGSSNSVGALGADLDGDGVTVDPTAARHQRKRRERQQLVEQLLAYHDPQLAHFLNQWCPGGWSEPGELIPEALFMDDVYNIVSPRALVHVVDQYLLTGDAQFGIFALIAALIGANEEITVLQSGSAIQDRVKEEFATILRDEERMRFVCMLAARLRARTPKSYLCALLEAQEGFCASRKAAEEAFDVTVATTNPGDKAKTDVDMTQWQKRESRSFAGKYFWYHIGTGRTQWEHPAEQFEPAPALFALPISVQEVASQVMGERRRPPSSNDTSSALTEQGLRYFVVDCRGLRSSEDLKSGRIPAAYTLDPSVFDSPELIERSMAALNPMKSEVHIVLVGNGVGLPPELMKTQELKTSVRDAVRHDNDCINRAALFFQKRGFRYISCLDGGYASWHAYMRDDPTCSPQELLGHVEAECHYCRYDTIIRTGEDPFKKRQKEKAKTRRKKSAMPTTTTMLVNGGEGDASIISTNAATQSNPPTSNPRRSLTSLSRSSITSLGSISNNMRSKLSDVKMPKLAGWRRGLSMSSLSRNGSTSNVNDTCSETATAEDGGSDRGSSTNDELESSAIVSEAEKESTRGAVAESPKKDFVGVFTIDYSDDEDEELEGPISRDAVSGATTARPPKELQGIQEPSSTTPSVALSPAAPTLSA